MGLEREMEVGECWKVGFGGDILGRRGTCDVENEKRREGGASQTDHS
jgi:hypothetical protein